MRSVTRVDEALLAASTVKFVGSATSGLGLVRGDTPTLCDVLTGQRTASAWISS